MTTRSRSGPSRTSAASGAIAPCGVITPYSPPTYRPGFSTPESRLRNSLSNAATIPAGSRIVYTHPQMSVELGGTLETLTYRNEQTGYSVARLQVPGRSGQVTVVGTLHDPVLGQTLQLTGDWQDHPRWGRQFRIEASRSLTPATAEGIERYLGSGLVKGVGPELARRIVA